MMRRASLAAGRRLQRQEWNLFADVTETAYHKTETLAANPEYRPDRVFQNNHYIVQVFYERKILGHKAHKLMIRRSDAQPVVAWHDLQRIKDEIYSPDHEAIQFFPRRSQLIDDANIYWLWVLEGDQT
jgi:hypothetical protein